MKILTDSALKAKYIFFLSIDDELSKIDSWIDRKFFRIIFESIHFNKKLYEADLKVMLSLCLKWLYQLHVCLRKLVFKNKWTKNILNKIFLLINLIGAQGNNMIIKSNQSYNLSDLDILEILSIKRFPNLESLNIIGY
jgi:hypothetical protein